MKEMKKVLSGMGLLLFLVCFLGIFTIEAEAKNASDAASEIDGVSIDGSRLIISKKGVVLKGYDLQGYDVYIGADGVTVENCTNITYIKLPTNRKNIKVRNNKVIGELDHVRNNSWQAQFHRFICWCGWAVRRLHSGRL